MTLSPITPPTPSPGLGPSRRSLGCPPARCHRDDDVVRPLLTEPPAHRGLVARNEENTVGDIVNALHHDLVIGGLVDELIGEHDHSTRAPARRGERLEQLQDAAGPAGRLRSGPRQGRGVRSRCAVRRHRGVTPTSPISQVTSSPACWGPAQRQRRAVHQGPLSPPGETVPAVRDRAAAAWPLLSMFFPHLAQVAQPWASSAGRRTVLERLSFVRGRRGGRRVADRRRRHGGTRSDRPGGSGGFGAPHRPLSKAPG